MPYNLIKRIIIYVELGDMMQKEKIMKILFFITILIMLFSFTAVAYATTDPTENPGDYKPNIEGRQQDIALRNRAGEILGAINVIGVISSVLTLMLIGIKYMLGSIEEKAEYKKTATTYIIGAILVFSATTIPNILYRIGLGIRNIN